MDETHCCLGEEFRSLCELNCGTCYNINLDCTPGPCNPNQITPTPTTVIIPSPPAPQCPDGCLNPITKLCSYLAPCPRANYCQRPFPSSLINTPTVPAVCEAFPDAVCKFTGCGGCTEYFEDSQGMIYKRSM